MIEHKTDLGPKDMGHVVEELQKILESENSCCMIVAMDQSTQSKSDVSPTVIQFVKGSMLDLGILISMLRRRNPAIEIALMMSKAIKEKMDKEMEAEPNNDITEEDKGEDLLSNIMVEVFRKKMEGDEPN